MFLYNNGGWNKSHGTIETTPRIDSFEVGAGWGTLFGFTDKGIPLKFDCLRETVDDRETVEVWHPKEGWSQILELSHKSNGFGGSQAFFLCPACGDRRRYLYLTGATFLCRKCARLNYRSQQETKSDCMYYYHKGMALVEKRLPTWMPFRPDGFSFCNYLPDRPRYVHRSTYARHLCRFLRYREKHADRQMTDMLRILKRLK